MSIFNKNNKKILLNRCGKCHGRIKISFELDTDHTIIDGAREEIQIKDNEGVYKFTCLDCNKVFYGTNNLDESINQFNEFNS